MSGTVLKYKVSFSNCNGNRHSSNMPTVRDSVITSRTARQLALAHHIQRLVDEGKLHDFAHAAKLLGITRARMSQVLNLQLLAPTLQASILSGELKISERRLRHVIRHADWRQHEAAARRF